VATGPQEYLVRVRRKVNGRRFTRGRF